MSDPKPSNTRRVRFLCWSWMAAAVVASVGLLPTNLMAQTLYGSVTGNVADGTGAALPGANVSIRNEATGLELTAVTDESGTYTIRNITGGTYTLRATLHGFKEFVQTGIPVTAGGIVRINGRLEIGALSESVTVTTEAALLKTDKADVSVDLQARGRRQPAAESVPQLSVPDEPRPGRDAAGVSERPDRHAGPLPLDQHQRHQSQQQRHAHRRRRQHQRLAAASRRATSRRSRRSRTSTSRPTASTPPRA